MSARILVVDDEPDSQSAFVRALNRQIETQIAHPQDIVEDDLGTADLVLVDLVLDRWGERDALASASLKPMNGLALAAVLRSHTEGRLGGSPTAFALHSARLEEISGGLPPGRREHSIARANNLEWVFEKVHGPAAVDALIGRIGSLADAVPRLPPSWPRGDAERTQEVVADLLALDLRRDWADRAWFSIEGAHPPTHELSEGSHGLAFLRWLLQRILPYPCFLWDAQHVAARFRVTEESLRRVLDRSSALRSEMDALRYRGILDQFAGARFWRSGVEALVWRITEGRSSDPKEVRRRLEEISGQAFEPLNIVQPVICIDDQFAPLDGAVESKAAVRVQPDDWPAYADQAWTTLELARGSTVLRGVVVDEDRERL